MAGIMLSHLVLWTLAFLGETRLARGRLEVALNGYGVLTGVPVEGLASVDGPPVELAHGFAEWFGVEFQEGEALREGVGLGASPDWAGRPPVELLGFSASPGGMSSRTRLGPLEIRAELEIEGEHLFAAVELVNTGERTLCNVFYSREWRTAARGWTFPPDLPMRRAAPERLARRVWMLDDLAPGATSGVLFSYRLAGPAREPLGAVEVPLRLYRDADWPDGLTVGRTNGISFGDYDADGWIDFFACESARLLRNAGGLTWELAADLDTVLPPAGRRYGSSFGDYDRDGLPDIGTEPRPDSGDTCFHLLHNLGGGPYFEDVAIDPAIVIGQPCDALSETICWGDVEDDGDLDMFLPVYPPWTFGGPGNFFLENLGPTGPGGEYRLIERSAEAGLDNPPGSARPEGAQFVDVDGDGDIDLYSNGTLYRNRSQDAPDFEPMQEGGSGIGLSQSLDEGALFFDYDLDGDQDLGIVYTMRGVRIWESRGDGTFFPAGSIVDEPRIGLDLGMSAEDWDNDGDIDFTTRQVFRRNRLIEDGERHFTVARHAINSMHLTSATPAWGDWDRDGDLDSALGNWSSIGHFYENTLYDASVLAADKPYVRVRVARDDPLLPRGLETEYGAMVELRLHGDPPGLRRVKFTASSHGYLNQNEYALHFALPPAPPPAAPVEGLSFDLSVDFPGRASRGVLRLDRHVNPALGDIALAGLAEREITVFRSGRVLVDGVLHAPLAGRYEARLFASGGGLASPDPALGLPEPSPAPGPAHWVGIEFTTDVEAGPSLARELVLDGQLAEPAACGEPFNIALWDVTDRLVPLLLLARAERTSERNHRTAFPLALELLPGRVYRCVAHVSALRASPLPGPGPQAEGLTVKGGLSFTDGAPCRGKAAAEARPDPARVYLALRTSPAAHDARRGGQEGPRR
jgi:hypothetical protein